ncbi:SUMF1/EgtB/PvdO family nonheme iron enzyme [Pseudoalteromonas sp. Of7M-16]|uniref:SUMF1/EgtB/PvdO family nonheme iron enzyme n=1 Tax=Pseudoalteromonas sp. Of7M-16 TaxID=2917756 RepID=UPI001EF40E98|nr:SUMF1/EgtB/PvdO family nonheme iron enzyme [Pseudoalteromonas sp. Of7M-16]MCG7546622.1 SUMF1/EgtB/PvdO family nonheme iron enzyme [Pseudoalteromonas sp. Of7M-16]
MLTTSLLMTSTLIGTAGLGDLDTLPQQAIEPIMITLPKGEYTLRDTEGKYLNRTVQIAPFSLGKYEVTVAEFNQFIQATNYTMPDKCYHKTANGLTFEAKGNWQANDKSTGFYHPVTCITWHAAHAYTQWLAKVTGKPYRLPTSVEWAYAAKAKQSSDYYFGDKDRNPQACDFENVRDLSSEGERQFHTNSSNGRLKWDCIDNTGYTSVVGTFKPNQFGLHDMLSNLNEMTLSCPEDWGATETSEQNCHTKISVGGDWKYGIKPYFHRSNMPTDFSGAVEGFRIALSGLAPPIEQQTLRTAVFKASLEAAQHAARTQNKLASEIPDAVQQLKIKQNGLLTHLSWQKSPDPEVSSYRVYRSYSSRGALKLIANNVLDPYFTDANSDVFTYRYAVVAVKHFMQSDYSNQVYASRVHTHILPGRIEAENTVGKNRNTVEITNDLDGRYHIGGWRGVLPEQSGRYKIKVSKAGLYKVHSRVASKESNQGFTLSVNGKQYPFPITDTGGFQHWQTQEGTAIFLEKGEHHLDLAVTEGNWRLNWIDMHPM